MGAACRHRARRLGRRLSLYVAKRSAISQLAACLPSRLSFRASARASTTKALTELGEVTGYSRFFSFPRYCSGEAKTKAARARPDPGSSPPATPVGEEMGEELGAPL